MRFTDYDTRLAAYAVIVDEHGRILLTWFNGEPPGWTLPGGGVEFYESVEEAVIREVREEAGYDIELGRILATSTFQLTDGARPFKSVRVVYDATITGGALGTTEVGGTTDFAQWLHPSDLDSWRPLASIVELALRLMPPSVGVADPLLRIRDVTADLIEDLAVAFADWPKSREQFVRDAERVAAGSADLLVADLEGRVVGYTGIRWTSTHPPFLADGIPEIDDFNVLPEFRRRGVGTALMDEAETRIARRSDRAGIGVGLHADHGSAQRMYVKRGYVPDGRGISRDGAPVAPGTPVRIDDDTVLWLVKRLR